MALKMIMLKRSVEKNLKISERKKKNLPKEKQSLKRQ